MTKATKMSSAEPSKEHAADCLVALGFIVEPIDEVQGAKRADLRATRGGEEYVVEAKSRSESTRWLEFKAKVETIGFDTLSREVKPWNAMSSQIEKAHRQLTETPASPEAVRIMWVPAVHDDDDFVLSCFFVKLYGLVRLSCIKRMSVTEPISTKDCYFYRPGDFRRFRGIDGVVLAGRTSGALCVNPFSPRAGLLRASALHKYFADEGAVRDPEVLDQEGRAFFLREDFAGSADRDSWAYIRKRYGVLTSPMFDHSFHGRVLLRADPVSPSG